MFGANLVIPAQICDELSSWHGKVYGHTDIWTDNGNDNTPLAWKVNGKNYRTYGLFEQVCTKDGTPMRQQLSYTF